jgi:hypothetical protein
MKSCKTTFKKGIINKDFATSLYNLLENTIEWDEGVRSRNRLSSLSSTGSTRKAKALRLGMIPEVDEAIAIALSSLTNVSYEVKFKFL